MTLNSIFKPCAVGAVVLAVGAVAIPSALFCADKLADGATTVMNSIGRQLDTHVRPHY